MPSNGYGTGARSGGDEEGRTDLDGMDDRSTDLALDPVGSIGSIGSAERGGNPRDGSRDRSGFGPYGSDRWARVLSAVTPAAMIAAVGIRIGSAGRRFAPDAAAGLDGIPFGVDVATLSAVAGVVHDLSVLLAVAVACAVGWLLVTAAVHVSTVGQ
ncbi:MULTISPECIES: hypothetical protein [Haloferacaceae]|uniref:Uncharacterized protein n=1 Tax=Halorubrum glutamatedens TaxID=2707018 RepID=A0ABD5QW35_9EURY|nr:hypothetical protein [Halobellus captivus]